MPTSRPLHAFQVASLNDALHRLFKARYQIAANADLDPDTLIKTVEYFADRAEAEQKSALASIEKWGAAAQAGQTMEECGELIVACHKHFFRDHNGATVLELATEIADVELMCFCLRNVIGSNLVDAEKNEKVRRLSERLGIV